MVVIRLELDARATMRTLGQEGKRREPALKGYGLDYGYYGRKTGSGLGCQWEEYYKSGGCNKKKERLAVEWV